MNYTLIRSNRKTVAIHIKPGNIVEVRAPIRTPKADIDKIVASKEKWIKEKLLLIQERSDKKSYFLLDYGDMVMYRGAEYPIMAREGARMGFDGVQFFIPAGWDSGQIKNACVQIYKILAKNVLTKKVLYFAKIMGVMPIAVKINSAKTRWGSCSAKKSLNFSWRLVMADEETIDYVVVHELAHITEMNHSDRFWRVVSGVLPDYKKLQERLKALQQRLGGEDWE